MTRRFLATTLCLAALAGGCGSDEPQPEGAKPTATETPAAAQTPAAPTREEVIAQGDDLCRRLNLKAKVANRKAAQIVRTGTSNEQILEDLAPVLASSYQRQKAFAEDFEALETPEGDEGKLARIKRNVKRQLDNLGELRDAAKAGDLEPTRRSPCARSGSSSRPAARWRPTASASAAAARPTRGSRPGQATMPAPTVSFVASSMRMNAPVARLEA